MNTSTFVYTTYIATTPEKLWEALTSGEFTRMYWFGRTLKTDWKAGSVISFVDRDGKTTDEGIVLKYEPYHLLSYTLKCVHDSTPYEQLPRVTFKLQQMDSAVKLTLKHTDLSADAFREESEGFVGINNGWPAIVSNLKSVLEIGRAMPAIQL